MTSFLSLSRKTERRLKQLRTILTIPGILLAAVAAAVACAYFMFEPTVLRVAVPADSQADQRLIRAAAELLNNQRASVRLRMVAAPDAAMAASSLDKGEADLAVLRSDQFAQSQLSTVLILRREAAVLLAPKSGKVQKIADLRNATVGVLDMTKSGGALDRILEFYSIAPGTGSRVALAQDQIAQAFQQRKIDALFLLGAVTSKAMAEAVSDAARGVRDLQFIDIEEAKAVAKRVPALEAIDVEQGAFGGQPARPPEELNTVGYAVLLATTPRLDQDTVADLARQMIAIRQNLNAAQPGAGLLEVPDTDDNTTFVIHPGVKSYVSGDRTTLFDRYGDWLYLVLFAGSGLGSLAAATIGFVQNQRRQEAIASIMSLERLFDEAREASSVKALQAIEEKADTIFRDALGRAARGELGDTQILTVELAMSEVRARLSEQRTALGRRKPAAVASRKQSA